MKPTKTLFMMISLATLSASAGSISVVLRADSDTTTYNQAAKDAVPTNTSSTRYLIHTGRVEYKGQVNERLAFQTRLRYDGVTNNTPNKTDNVTDTVDILQLSHKLADDWTLTIGKTSTEILADDGIPFSDVYLASRARFDIAATYLYGTGAKLAHSFADQDVKLMTFNQSEGTTTEQSRSAYGIIYKGKFNEKTLLPSLSFHKDHRQSALSDQDPTVEMLAVGLKYDPKPYTVSLDFLQNQRDNMTGIGPTATAAAKKKNTVTSYLLDAAYQMDPQWIARARFDSSLRKAEDNTSGTESKTNYEGLSLVAEYKPFPENQFRYHIAWTQLTEKPQSGSDQITQHLIVGAMIYADFLK